MAIFNMFDLKEKGFFELFDKNSKFFEHSKTPNWFYLKNDQAYSERPGNIWAGTTDRHCNDNDGPCDGNSAGLFYCDMPINDVLRTLCSAKKDGIIDFFLQDGKTEAYMGIVEFEGREVIALFINNNPQTIDLTFSKEGKTTYEEASKEQDSLPWLVERNIIFDLLPEGLKNFFAQEDQRGL